MKKFLIMMIYASLAHGQSTTTFDCNKEPSKCILNSTNNFVLEDHSAGCLGGWTSYHPDGNGKCVITVIVTRPDKQKLSCQLVQDDDAVRITCSYPDPDFKKPRKE